MMLRKSAFLAILLVPSALQAQTPATGQARLEIVGDAQSACVIRGPATATASNAGYSSTGPSSGQIRITEMVDPATAQARATIVELALNVVCNSPHRVVLRSDNGGLLRAGGRPGRAAGRGDFVEFLPYRFRANWLGQESVGASDSGATMVMNANRGGAGQLSVAIAVPAGGSPLIAGDYRDSVIVEFRAAN